MEITLDEESTSVDIKGNNKYYQKRIPEIQSVLLFKIMKLLEEIRDNLKSHRGRGK